MNPDFHLLVLYKVECMCTRNQIKYVTLIKYICVWLSHNTKKLNHSLS